MAEDCTEIIKNYFQDKKILYQKLYEYLGPSCDNIEEEYENLNKVINDQNIRASKYDLKILLNIIAIISDNMGRYTTFFDKITKLLINLKDTLKQKFSNYGLFNIFKNNKRILLFLLKEEIITLDDSIINVIESEYFIKNDYPLYFAPEIAQYNEEEYTLSPNFEENRQNGENTGEIAILIRKDLIDEFITYVNQNDYPLNSTIKSSIFETNSFLLEFKPTLIEYATFFGSNQIFKYLYKNGAELTSSLWIYAMHNDNNPEMIELLLENKVKPGDSTFLKCFYEAIKCHHNNLALYIQENLMRNDELKNDELGNELFLKYFNFQFIDKIDINDQLIFTVCKYDYLPLMKIILENTNIDVNIETTTLIDGKRKLTKPLLYLAVKNDNYEMVQLLLTNKNIDVNKPKKCKSIKTDCYENYCKSCTPLALAVKKSYYEIVKLLLSHPDINVNSKHKFKNQGNDYREIKPALILAIENNDLNMVNILLSNPKIDVNIRYEIKFPYSSSYEVRTALCVAIMEGNIEIVESLLKSNNIKLNDEQLIKVNYPYDEWLDPVTRKSRSALSIAIDSEDIDIIKLLLSCPKIKINSQADESVDSLSGMSSFTEYKNAEGWGYIMPLIYDVLKRNDSGYTIKTKKTPIFCQAIEKKNVDIIEYFLSLDQIDANDCITIDSYSIEKDKYDYSDTDYWNWSPCANTEIPALCIAVKNNDEETVKILLSNSKIDVNAQYLKESYEFRSKENGKKDEDEEEEEGNEEDEWILKKEIKYPLHIAVQNGNKRITKLLLESEEIDLNEVDDKHKKAFDYAGNDEIKELFK